MEYEKKSNEGYTMADETRSVDWDHSCIMPSSFCIVIHSSPLMNMGFWNIVAGTTTFPRQYHAQLTSPHRREQVCGKFFLTLTKKKGQYISNSVKKTVQQSISSKVRGKREKKETFRSILHKRAFLLSQSLNLTTKPNGFRLHGYSKR